MVCWTVLLTMIEFCTKRRMLFAIAVLTFISVVVLLVENNMSKTHEMKEVSKPQGNKSTDCSDPEQTHVIQECAACSKYELQKVHEYCKDSGYREKVSCKLPNEQASKVIIRSCPKVTWMEERNFFCFEALMALLATSSYGVVHMRRRRLDKLLIEKVNKQIAAGV